jgi:hypothetical protein
MKRNTLSDGELISGECLCGKIRIEIGVPARWAWHDHTQASRLAHGAAYATYVGCWRSRFRVTKGAKSIVRFEDEATGTARCFCKHCGTPLLYERAHSPQMVNVPRALFKGRTGREPRYHVGIQEKQEWAYAGEALVPLAGFPGIVWNRARKRKPRDYEGMF